MLIRLRCTSQSTDAVRPPRSLAAWAALPPADRAACLHKLADLSKSITQPNCEGRANAKSADAFCISVVENGTEIARLDAIAMGRPVGAHAGE
jgi:hypothetical protein